MNELSVSFASSSSGAHGFVPGEHLYATLSNQILDTHNPSSVTESSSHDYINALKKSNKIRPASWRKTIVALPDVLISLNQCLMYSFEKQRYIVGDSVNWAVSKCPRELPSASSLQSSSDNRLEILDNAFILQAPGFAVYGHWLLDFVPRILLIKEMSKYLPSIPIIVRSMPVWAQEIVTRLDVTNPIVLIPAEMNIYAKNLFIPLFMKQGYVYCEEILKESFSVLRDLFYNPSVKQTGAAPSKKIFFARSKLPAANNQCQLIDQFAAHGFNCVYPDKLSLEEQITLYSGVHKFVGEDSSAMHNIGFAESSLGVIFGRPRRLNLWHAAVASSTGQRIHYDSSVDEVTDTQYAIPGQSISSALDLCL